MGLENNLRTSLSSMTETSQFKSIVEKASVNQLASVFNKALTSAPPEKKTVIIKNMQNALNIKSQQKLPSSIFNKLFGRPSEKQKLQREMNNFQLTHGNPLQQKREASLAKVTSLNQEMKNSPEIHNSLKFYFPRDSDLHEMLNIMADNNVTFADVKDDLSKFITDNQFQKISTVRTGIENLLRNSRPKPKMTQQSAAKSASDFSMPLSNSLRQLRLNPSSQNSSLILNNLNSGAITIQKFESNISKLMSEFNKHPDVMNHFTGLSQMESDNIICDLAANNKTWGDFSSSIAPKVSSSEMWSKLQSFNGNLKGPYVPSGMLRPSFTDVKLPANSAVKFSIGNQQPALWVHASHVKMQDNSQYILSQHPGFPDEAGGNNAAYFWKMAGQENVTMVIDLSQPGDSHTSAYHPQTPGKMTFQDHTGGKTTVELREKPIEKDGVITYKLFIDNHDGKEPKEITRMHYTGWKDFGGAEGNKVLDLINTVDNANSDKMCVHCRAGVGRSGTFTVLRTVKHLVDSGVITKDNYGDKLLEIIKDVRTQRGSMTVQTEDQVKMLLDSTKTLLGLQ
ncbi:MAG: protein-tyrosine phosphatase family protein [Parachlamydiales bacterium]